MKIDLKNKKLSINGGKPIRKKKWFNNITTDRKELAIVKKVYKTALLNHGLNLLRCIMLKH